MTWAYVAITMAILTIVALAHAARLAFGWEVQVGPNDIPMSASWLGLVVATALAVGRPRCFADRVGHDDAAERHD